MLTTEQIRTGQLLTERAQRLQAALQALVQVEADYIALLRDLHDLDESWMILDWMRGFEKVGDHDENN